MNERILELSFEAQQYALNNTTGPDLSNMYALWQEKFAELIVRECAKVSERTGALNEADYEGEMIADAIKEHFGVEE